MWHFACGFEAVAALRLVASYSSPKVAEQLQGRAPKKVIVVPGKLVNVVG